MYSAQIRQSFVWGGYSIDVRGGSSKTWGTNNGFNDQVLNRTAAFNVANDRTESTYNRATYSDIHKFFGFLDTDMNGTLDFAELHAAQALAQDNQQNRLTTEDMIAVDTRGPVFALAPQARGDATGSYKLFVDSGTNLKETGSFSINRTWGTGNGGGPILTQFMAQAMSQLTTGAESTLYSQIAQRFSRIDANANGQLERSEIEGLMARADLAKLGTLKDFGV